MDGFMVDIPAVGWVEERSKVGVHTLRPLGSLRMSPRPRKYFQGGKKPRCTQIASTLQILEALRLATKVPCYLCSRYFIIIMIFITCSSTNYIKSVYIYIQRTDWGGTYNFWGSLILNEPYLVDFILFGGSGPWTSWLFLEISSCHCITSVHVPN